MCNPAPGFNYPDETQGDEPQSDEAEENESVAEVPEVEFRFVCHGEEVDQEPEVADFRLGHPVTVIEVGVEERSHGDEAKAMAKVVFDAETKKAESK